jgi:HlyD family secretion protein
MTNTRKKWFIRAALLLFICAMALLAVNRFALNKKDEGLSKGNGRIEAVEIDIAAKLPGRVKDVLVKEGDFVTAGQILAHMDTQVLEAQRREAEANLQQARSNVANADSVFAQRIAEKKATLAVVAQRKAELDVAKIHLARTETLVSKKLVAVQILDDDRANFRRADAAYIAAQAQVKAAEANVDNAKCQILGAQSAETAAKETINRIQAEIDDSALKAPCDGRVQHRVAEPGEVLGAGGRVLELIDLSDVYMIFFLPAAAAGRVAIGSEVRLILDASPQYVIPAKVSFVADVAQFTPKTVETEQEREKLVFRIKAQLPPDLLKKHITQVKTGLPGVAYLRLNSRTPWPPFLNGNILK